MKRNRDGDGGQWRARRAARVRVCAPAHLVTADGAAFDCVLVDLSPDRAKVYLAEPAEVPDLVTLWPPCGESRLVRRLWQFGPYMGFEAAGGPTPPDDNP
jgi:hypothetical protein